jgi:hypothetical protein
VASKKYKDANRGRVNSRAKELRDADPDKYTDYALQTKYGITLKERDALLAEQSGTCAICGADAPGGRGGWHTDHCHTTKKVRGILCTRCNTGIGMFKDNPATLAAAINYLSH